MSALASVTAHGPEEERATRHLQLAHHAASRLGDVLVRQGLIRPDALQIVLNEQRAEANQGHWILLGDLLEQWHLSTHDEIDAALSELTRENEPVHFDGHAHASVANRLKRLLDIVGALVGLGLALTVLPFVALAIHLEDGGPVFFQQHRVGCHGWQFPIWKFRTMVPHADRLKLSVKSADALFFSPTGKDPRITRVGHVLRKTMLDELPQFWNVLKGEMSLVGTRPPTLDEVCHYSAEHWRRLEVKPGLTGLWQASGNRHLRGFDDVVALDLEYQRTWSIGLDLSILLRTVISALRKPTGM